MSKKQNNFLVKTFRIFVYVFPVILFFSYHPLISLGMNESMNFELSLPLLWLVLFDCYSFFLYFKLKIIPKISRNYIWFIFPIFMTISLFWTYDLLRGILIGGVLWLIYFAGFNLFIFKDYYIKDEFWKKFFKIYLISSLFICMWCFLQCIFDVLGMEREYSLMCAGCTYKIFGFPHPNGFAAEPQFMGNLLLAPIAIAIYLIEKKKYYSRKLLIICLFIMVATLFLTLSRGAIYAFGVAMIFKTIIYCSKLIHSKYAKKNFIKSKTIVELLRLILMPWALIIIAFLFTLNIQGIISEISPTNDTYVSGVSKVINQISLGKIDLGGSQVKKEEVEKIEDKITENNEKNQDSNGGTNRVDEEETAIFDGYIEVSTNARTSAWKGALKTWSKDFRTIIFGVGLGGGLKGMYENGNISSSKEIINNQYISILLEGGIIGMTLLIVSIIMLFKIVFKNENKIYLFTLIIMYMLSLLFFSGLPNALHIYIIFPILLVYICFRKKLVS